MVEWSIVAMRSAASVGSIVVAAPPGAQTAPSFDSPAGDLRVLEGGETRAQSVSNALEGVDTEVVAIHDAARPMVTPDLIDEVVDALLGDPDAAGAIAATPVTDTIKQVVAHSEVTKPALSPSEGSNADFVVERTLDRERLWAAQTPQVFRVEALRRAIEADSDAAAAATDEAMLVEAAGGRVLICPAPPENLKVTTPLDLRIVEGLLEQT